MCKNENGSIIIETLISFVLFASLCWGILSIISITTLQARVHYALTQTAIELSVYGYVVHALGFSDNLAAMSAGASEAQEMFNNINIMINTLDIEGGIGMAGDIADDPMAIISNLLSYGLTLASHELIIRPIFNKYLRLGNQSAADYLRNNRVRGEAGFISGLMGHEIDFTGSHLITENGNIVIVATYNIDFTFGILPIPERFRTIEVVQSVKTRVWLGGYGEGFN